MKTKSNYVLSAGFTLVELLVVIGILATLLSLSLLFINPVAQLNKVDDAERKSDLQEIKTALDLYYNDHSCYPQTLPFGSPWTENGTVYMRKVPQDPTCSSTPGSCYTYKNLATSACPQWNVVFSQLSKSDSGVCQLSSLSGCVPADFSSSWACTVSGAVDCSFISSTTIVTAPTATPSPSPTPSTSPVPQSPTPTPTPPCASPDYSCSGSPSRCNVVPAGTGQYCTPACGGAC